MVETARLDALTDRPHAEVFAAAPRTVRLALDAGERVAPHRHPGADVLVHVLSGRLAVTVGGETRELGAGELVRFDGDREVSPEAVDDSVALVVLAGAGDREG